MSAISIIIILSTTFIGLAIYIAIAQREQNDKIEKFFLAGRNIGVTLFEHTTWATSNGSANGIWYAVWLGYTIGLAAIWLQCFWCIGIILYAFLVLPRIIIHSEKYTLHGFLGAYYGTGARYIASFVSLTGLFVCIGFEVSYVSGFFTQILGINKELIVPIIFAFSIFISVFCTIGGFSANAKTDRISNLLATTSVILLLVLLLVYKYSHNIQLKDATIFPLMDNPWSFYWGIFFFGLYQFVDMTNWQTVSANSILKDSESIKIMQKKMISAALKIFLFPVVTGSIVGWILRSITANISQETILSGLTMNYLPINGLLSVFIIAGISFSFVVASLSATDSWLLASSQTISWDLTDYEMLRSKNFEIKKLTDEEHKTILRRARLYLIITGVVVTGFIYWVSIRWNQVFALQFVMFGAGLSMIPALLHGLWFCLNEKHAQQFKNFAFLSITVGFLTAIGIFVWSLAINDPNLVNCIPYVTLAISTVIMLLGHITNKKVNAI